MNKEEIKDKDGGEEKEEEISKEEIGRVIRKMKKGKAAGEDDMNEM